jgi:hypothetical protein
MSAPAAPGHWRDLLGVLVTIMNQPNPDHSEGRAAAQVNAATALIKHGNDKQIESALAFLRDGALGNRGFGNTQRVLACTILLEYESEQV